MNRKLLLLFILIHIITYSQSNKARKAHEAILTNEFTKAKQLLSEIEKKNEEITLLNYLNYEYFINEKNEGFNLDSSYHYLINAVNSLKNESEKTIENYSSDFSFNLTNSISQFKSIYFLAHQSVKRTKNPEDYQHFISSFGDNEFLPIAIRELDTIQFQLFKLYGSVDSLYKFKTYFKDSKLLNETNDLIVVYKIENCKYKNSIDCFESILKEFPKTGKSETIKSEILKIQDSLAIIEFNFCKNGNSIDCLKQLKVKYPKAKIINEIDIEIDRINYSKYIANNNIDSILYFIDNFKKSLKIDDAKLRFVSIFEDSIKRSNLNEVVFELQYLQEKFHPLVQKYNLINNENVKVQDAIDSLVFRSIQYSGIEALAWYIKEFPNGKHLDEVKEEYNSIKSLNNAAFLTQNTDYQNFKFGLLNMTTGSLNFGFFLDDVKGFSNDLAAVKYNGKWGFINRNGNIEIPFVYDDVNSFKSEVTGVCEDGVWYFINTLGIPISDKEYLKIGDFSDGLFNIKSFTGGWQYVNLNEEVVSKENYYFATSFIKGFAAVSPSDGHIQIINTKFNVVKSGFEMRDTRVYYGERGSYSNNIESFEYSEKLKKHIINSQIFYSAITNNSEIDEPANANDFAINDVKFDESGQYLIDGRGFICYSSNDAEIDYSVKDGKIDIFLDLIGNDKHPVYPANNYQYTVSGDNYKYWKNNNKTIFTLLNIGQISSSRRLVGFNSESILYREDLGFGIKTKEGIDLIKNASFKGFTLFQNGISIVSSEAGAYLINDQGQKLTKLYQSIYRLNDHTFIVKMKNDTKYFLINDKDVALSDLYDVIEKSVLQDNLIVKNYTSQKANCKENYKIGLIHISGKVIIPVVFDKLIQVPNQVIVEKYSIASQSKNGDHSCNVEGKIFNYAGEEIEIIPPGFRYLQTDSKNTYFQKSTYKPNSEEIIKRLVIEVPIFQDMIERY